MEVCVVTYYMALAALTVLNRLNKEISLEESDINIDFHLTHLEDHLKQRWHSLQFTLHSKENGNFSTKIDIDFITDDDLDRLSNIFTELKHRIKYNKL